MTFVNVPSLVFFITISVYSTPSVSLVYIHSEDLGHRLCRKIPVHVRNCEPVIDSAFSTFSSPDFHPEITTPRIAIAANSGLSFNVVFKNAERVPRVRAFAMMGEGADVDIDLRSTARDYSITCFGYGNASKVSSNIVMSSETIHSIRYLNDDYPNVYKLSVFHNLGKVLQSGRFTCDSTTEHNIAETFNIFTQSSAQNGTSPFVKYGEQTIQRDEKSNGFIVPCRTNYRMEIPPDLLWRKNEEGNLTMLNTEEKKSFIWDPLVGFRFHSSVRNWEMEILVCRFDSFEATYLPTSSQFTRAVFVTAKEDQISCTFGTRNASSDLLLPSKLAYEQANYYSCLTYVGCDLKIQLGLLFLNNPHRAFSTQTFGMPQLSESSTHGILSCVAEHFYDDKHVPEIRSKIFFQGLDSIVYLLPGSYPNDSVIRISPVDGTFYRNHTELYHEFTCTSVGFMLFGDLYFIFRHKDLSETVDQDNQANVLGRSEKSQFIMKLHTNITHAICLMLTMDGKVMSAEIPLQILDAFAPLVENGTSSLRKFMVGKLTNFTLTCPITGGPPPQYRWSFDEKNTDLVEGTNTRNLTFREFRENVTGNYSCEAWNDYGSNSFEFQVKVQPQDILLRTTSVTGISVAAVLLFILVCTAVIFALEYFRVQRQVRNLTPEETAEFLSGIRVSQGNSNIGGSELALQVPFTKLLEPNSLFVARDSVLGRGQYGIVYRGILHGQAVAVKTFKRSVTSDDFRAGLVEVKLMHFVGEHPNIVKFIGADVTNIEKRDILIVMELSLFGSLENHIKMLRPSAQAVYTNTTKPQYTNLNKTSTNVSLFGYCEQIAFAMEYLESKRVIHGDLATRNVLVFSHGVVKVTDFGYSRHLYEQNIYKSKPNRPLPWRSASIELLRHMEFSTESDIWAFGVTVWEIFTYGNVPFAGERWNERFVRSLENGMRLKKPSGLSENQFSFLKDCWAVEKSQRPRFSALKHFLAMEKENVERDLKTTKV